MADKVSKKELEEIAKRTDSDVVRTMALDAVENEFQGDEVAQKMIRLTQIMTGMQAQKGAVDEKQVKQIIRKTIETDKIKLSDLDSTIKSMIQGKPTQVSFKITVGKSVKTVTTTLSAEVTRPLMQKVFSDLLARNNVYLYGMAGTGKTFSAGVIAKSLDWDLIEVSCNQFTSPLELIGGQTIDGYQEGKVTRAYGNLDAEGNPTGRGCVLLLDELPKIDPNTAGVLNQMLARVGEFDSKGEPKPIENGRGQKIHRGNIFVVATGNSLLNTQSSDYEANFKQDLSLQDRFVGSTYQVYVDVEFEWKHILNEKWAFLCIYLNKLRYAIEEEGFANRAFVSIRIMQSVQKTFNVYRAIIGKGFGNKTITSDPQVSYTPADNGVALGIVSNENVKTVEDSMSEFFSLFTEEQADELKNKTGYSDFIEIERTKRKLPVDKINTPQEMDEMLSIIAEAKSKHKY